MRKSTLIKLGLVFFFFVNVFALSLLPTSYTSYAAIGNLVVLGIALAVSGPACVRFRAQYWPFYTFLAAHMLLIVAYTTQKDLASVQNLIALALSYYGIFVFANSSIDYLGYNRFRDVLFVSFLWLLAGAFVTSAILTAVGFRYAPAYYPWEALGTGQRLLLLRASTETGTVGHSIAQWLAMLGLAYVIFVSKASRLHRGLLAAVLAVLLFETESRSALLFLLFVLATALMELLSPRIRRLVLLSFSATLVLYYAASLNPTFVQKVTSRVIQLQEVVPNVRIHGTEQHHASSFVGRDTLNQALFAESFKAPVAGQGDTAPILLYGVTNDGRLASARFSHSVAKTESSLRLLVKYGWPYFLLYVLFVFFPAIQLGLMSNRRALRRKIDDYAFLISIYFAVYVAFINGLFEQIIGHNAILLLILALIWRRVYQHNEEPSVLCPSNASNSHLPLYHNPEKHVEYPPSHPRRL